MMNIYGDLFSTPNVIVAGEELIIIERLQAEIEKLKGVVAPDNYNFLVIGKADYAKLQDEVEKHRWIPVSERLPEKTGEYLVLPYIKHCPVLWYQDGWYWYNHQDDGITDSIGYCEETIPEITHWRPMILPE